eukprot:GGOE01005550.1.p1 GENE.GGOE01005550.1~~GGOE01005550.1.p1  ORF type:complete len:781 (-),score=159.61 GGOE01005550.1:397-2412(-)
MAALAPKYPDTTWLAIAGDLHLNVSNWGIAYAQIHEPTYLAGIVAGYASHTGKVGCVMPIKLPETHRQLAAFALGVAHVNASYRVHVGWTDNWNSARHDVLGTGALARLGCDVIFYGVDGVEGLKEAKRNHLNIIGFNSDQRMQIGETVLASPYFIWGIIYFQVAQMVLLGTFKYFSPVDLFPGMEEGAVALSDLSFLVKKAGVVDVEAARQSFLNGSDPFCGVIRTNEGTTVGAPGHCSTQEELYSMSWQPFNVIDHDIWQLPSQVCDPGEYAIWRDTTWQWSCLPCPAGTYSLVVDTDTNESIICTPCQAGRVAKAKSSSCSACNPGTAPSASRISCEECPADTYSADGSACIPCSDSLESLPGSDQCSERTQSIASTVIVFSVLGACAGISVTVLVLVLFQRHATTTKVMQNAPKGDVVIMVTNVKSSTALWDRYPEAMSWAVNIHNRVMRHLLAEFDGYEVKTVGDTFLVVFQDASQAIHCAMQLQEFLLQQHWPLELLEEEACSTQRDETDRVIWCGLRVRTGMHFGAPELVIDRERGRVDYLGHAVNIAALVQSKASGGQTLITEALYEQLLSDIIVQHHFFSIGAQYFKGVTRPVEVFSILPESLSTRVFAEVTDNVCLRCECATVCPKCDAVIQQSMLSTPHSPERARSRSLFSNTHAAQRLL